MNMEKSLKSAVGAGFKPAPTGTKNHDLSEIVRALKTFSARKINEMRNAFGEKIRQLGKRISTHKKY